MGSGSDVKACHNLPSPLAPFESWVSPRVGFVAWLAAVSGRSVGDDATVGDGEYPVDPRQCLQQGRRVMNSYAPTARAGASISASVAPGKAYPMLSRTVREKGTAPAAPGSRRGPRGNR